MKKILILIICVVSPLAAFAAPPSPYFSESLSSTAVQASTGASNVRGFMIYNPNNVPIFVHKYDALIANVTVGTTAQNSAPWPVASNGFLWLVANGQSHGYYATGLAIAATTTATSAGTTAPSSPLIISISFQ